MSFGRVVGPTVGAALVSSGSFTVVGVVALVSLLAAAATIEVVATTHRWRQPVAAAG